MSTIVCKTDERSCDDVVYRNVVINEQPGKFTVENHVFDDGDVYDMPLMSFDNLEDAIRYAEEN